MKVHRYWIENWKVKHEEYYVEIDIDRDWVYEKYEELFNFPIRKLDNSEYDITYCDSCSIKGYYYTKTVDDVLIIKNELNRLKKEKSSTTKSYTRSMEQFATREKELSVLEIKYK